MSRRSPRPLALGLLLAGCGPAAPPPPGRALAEARGRCRVAPPPAREDAPLDPLSSFAPAGGRMNPDVSAERAFYALTRPPTGPREGDGGPVEFRLRARPVVSPGEPLGLELSVVNRARGPVVVFRTPDESDTDALKYACYPYYKLYVRPENSPRAYAYGHMGEALCGKVTPLDEGDAFAVGPNEAAPAGGPPGGDFEGARLLAPGRYVLWAVYRSCATGRPPPADAPALGSLQGEYASNPVTIEVR